MFPVSLASTANLKERISSADLESPLPDQLIYTVFSLGALAHAETSDLHCWLELVCLTHDLYGLEYIQYCMCTHSLRHTDSTLHAVQTHEKDAKESVVVHCRAPSPRFSCCQQIRYASHYSFTTGQTSNSVSVVNTSWILNMPKSELHSAFEETYWPSEGKCVFWGDNLRQVNLCLFNTFISNHNIVLSRLSQLHRSMSTVTSKKKSNGQRSTNSEMIWLSSQIYLEAKTEVFSKNSIQTVHCKNTLHT